MATPSGFKLRITYNGPFPSRAMDDRLWTAVDDNTYDGALPSGPRGDGATIDQAVRDLAWDILDRQLYNSNSDWFRDLCEQYLAQRQQEDQ